MSYLTIIARGQGLLRYGGFLPVPGTWQAFCQGVDLVDTLAYNLMGSDHLYKSLLQGILSPIAVSRLEKGIKFLRPLLLLVGRSSCEA